MVMRTLPEAVECQQFGLFHVGLSLRPADIAKNVDREAAVAVLLPAHLEAKADVPGFEDVRAPIVFDRVPFGDESFSGAGFHIWEDVPDGGEVGYRSDGLVAGPVQHLWQLGLQRPDGPTDGIAVGDRVHSAVYAHAAADPA